MLRFFGFLKKDGEREPYRTTYMELHARLKTYSWWFHRFWDFFCLKDGEKNVVYIFTFFIYRYIYSYSGLAKTQSRRCNSFKDAKTGAFVNGAELVD